MGLKTFIADRTPISPATASRILVAFLLIGFALRLGVAIHLPRTAHPDEIFQTQEPAHRLAFGNGIVTWEWRDGVRSWVFPAFLAGVMRATSWMGPGSSGYLFGIKLVLSLLSLITVWFAFEFAKRESGIEAAIVAAGTCAMWYAMVDYGPRPFTEVISAHALLPGLYFGVYGEKFDERKRLFLAGLLCGLAVCLRIQLAPAIAFAVLYFCYPAWKKRILPLALGLLVPALLFGAVDAYTWGYPFASFFNYVQVNLLRGHGAMYGAEPWYWHIGVGLPQQLGPILILALFGIPRSPFLSWLALILIASHSAIPHKEERFLYAVWPIAITLAAMGMVDIFGAWNERRKSRLSSRAIVLACLSLSAGVLAGVGIGYHFFGKISPAMPAFDRLSTESNVCGVGFIGMSWVDTGGYTHLHRDVPMVFLPSESEMNQTAESFNAIVSKGSVAVPPAGFLPQGCWFGGRNEVCLYQRPGPCASPGENEINARLRRTGE